MQTSVHFLRALCAYMRDQNSDVAAFLHRAGLEPEQLDDPGLDVATMVAAAKAAYEVSGDPALALHLGASVPLHAFGVLGVLLSRSPTLRTVVEDLQRYAPLLAVRGSFSL